MQGLLSISDAGCAPQALQLPSGPTTFIVTNSGSTSVLKPGAYSLNCPGGTSAATGTLTVTE